MVQLLIQRGADVHAPPACQGGITALAAAAKKGSYQVALILLKVGASINAEMDYIGRITALQLAISKGQLDMVHLLLKAGADPHLPENIRYVRAVKMARERGHIAIASLLES